MLDQFGRKIEYLRISVTDRCNLRCKYCMPEDGIPMVKHEDILSYDEILRLVNIFSKLGFSKVKLTGGEPLVRKDLSVLVKGLKEIEGIEEVTLTTNGALFESVAVDLWEAGIDKINFSLDTLNPRKYEEITRKNEFYNVLSGIDKALEFDLKTSINVVTLKNYNFEEIADLAGMAYSKPIDVRFIEMMPIGFGNEFTGYFGNEILDELVKEFGEPDHIIGKTGNGPARFYHFKGFKGNIGIISSISNNFCDACNKVRLKSDGFLKLCLGQEDGIDLKALLRSNMTDDEILYLIKSTIYNKPKGHEFLNADKSDKTPMSEIGG